MVSLRCCAVAVLLVALGLARSAALVPAQDLRDAIRQVSGPRDVGTVVSPDDLPAAFAAAAAGREIDYSGASGEVDVDEVGDVLSDYAVWRVSDGAVEDTGGCWRCTRDPDVCEPSCPVAP